MQSAPLCGSVSSKPARSRVIRGVSRPGRTRRPARILRNSVRNVHCLDGCLRLRDGLFQHPDERIQPAPALDGLGREPAVRGLVRQAQGVDLIFRFHSPVCAARPYE